MPQSDSSFSGDEDQIVEVFPDTLCLFCSQEYKNPLEIYDHCLKDHNFDLYKIIKDYKLDTFEYIKLINFIRSSIQQNPKCDIKYLIKECDWKDEKYLKPVMAIDGLLMIDFEDLEEMAQHNTLNSATAISSTEKILHHNGLSDDNARDLSSKRMKNSCDEDNNSKKTIIDLKSKVFYLQDTLESMKDNMKTLSDKLLEYSFPDNEEIVNNQSESMSINENDNQYFNSYAYISIHEDMLKDTVRTGGYSNAIVAKGVDGKGAFEGRTVLDVGCGTGILSMLSARAGAKAVFAVDQSDIIYEAMDIAKENELDHKITFIKGKIEDITLPIEKVDIIVSEWMGYFLLSESMMTSIIRARDKWLAPNGLMLPSRLRLYLQPLHDRAAHNDKLAFWNDVYGFKMTCLKRIKKREIDLDDLYVKMAQDPSIKLLSEPIVIKDVDMSRIKEGEIEVDKFPFDFRIEGEAQQEITAFICYFDVDFYPDDFPNQVSFSTGPKSPSTHWKQTVLHLPETLTVNKGENVQGSISMTQLPHDKRTWCIQIDLGSDKQYIFDLS